MARSHYEAYWQRDLLCAQLHGFKNGICLFLMLVFLKVDRFL